jgi:hypothetical protein
VTQADGRNGNVNQRIALHLTYENDGNHATDGWFRFSINPQNYKHEHPQRTSVIKTKSKITVEDYNTDLETITFSGTTGFRKDSQGMTGEARVRKLQTLLDDYATAASDGNKAPFEMELWNFTEGVGYVTTLAPEGYTIERSVDQPLLWTYSVTLYVLRNANIPSDSDSTDSQLGNTAGGSTVNPATGTNVSLASYKAVGILKGALGYN